MALERIAGRVQSEDFLEIKADSLMSDQADRIVVGAL
jgi:hypothetical protein